MFKYFAESIAFLLINNKIVDIEERDVYVYGLEVLLLNLSNVLVALLISLFTGTFSHFLAFLLVFVPLRIFGGGCHANTSEMCFFITAFIYSFLVWLVKLFPLLYKNNTVTFLLFILIIPIIKFAPVENKNNPLSGSERKRNKILSIGMVAFDSIVFITLRIMSLSLASSVLVFMAIISVLMLVGVCMNR